ncbi:unnamed protein product [Sphenostylis stenocarpa]|uniref:Uncharacterized protein n=1 Tax=Sphenostylis stenocarpa TaxID=92480 RepID=A0AA87B6Y1_9FABA|nr:unnamed protein product [Sphenostylis stenocarpa]
MVDSYHNARVPPIHRALRTYSAWLLSNSSFADVSAEEGPILKHRDVIISNSNEARRSPEAKAEPKLLKERQNRVSKS